MLSKAANMKDKIPINPGQMNKNPDKDKLNYIVNLNRGNTFIPIHSNIEINPYLFSSQLNTIPTTAKIDNTLLIMYPRYTIQSESKFDILK